MELDLLMIFRIIVYICLAGFLVTLIVFLIKLIGTVSNINRVFVDNKKEIDKSIGEVPSILENINGITDKTDRLVGDISPDIRNIAHNVTKTTDTVSSTVTDVTDTVGFVAESVVDSVSDFRYGLTSKPDYFSYATEIFTLIKSLLKK